MSRKPSDPEKLSAALPPAPVGERAGGRAAERPDVLELLRSGLDELGRSQPEGAVEKLADLTLLLARWAARINLTGHRTAQEIGRRLVLDAAAQLTAIEAVAGVPPRSLADLGSGAGFPGLPLAILAPSCETVLVESRERRHHFQRAAIRSLSLRNVTAVLGRIEVVPCTQSELVIAQAVARPSEVLPLLVRWAIPGGCIVIPGGSDGPRPGWHPQLAETQILTYALPLGGPIRTLWLGRLCNP